MCFSPEASFVGGVIISAIGIATVKKIHKSSQLLFAIIPLFFGFQQITEGFLWLTLPYSEYIYIQKATTYIFLIMAEVLWPIMIPLSVLLMEDNIKRKRILKGLLSLGILMSLYYTFCMLFFNVTPQIMNYHIQYNTGFPDSLAFFAFLVYLIATISPLFVSSVKKMYLFGILLFLSCLVTLLFLTQYLTSVWCFFAALISGVIYWILIDTKREFNLLNKIVR